MCCIVSHSILILNIQKLTAMAIKQQTTKQHISFRLEPETIKQIKELKSLFGVSEGTMVEKAIKSFFDNRKVFLEEDMREKLQRATESL